MRVETALDCLCPLSSVIAQHPSKAEREEERGRGFRDGTDTDVSVYGVHRDLRQIGIEQNDIGEGNRTRAERQRLEVNRREDAAPTHTRNSRLQGISGERDTAHCVINRARDEEGRTTTRQEGAFGDAHCRQHGGMKRQIELKGVEISDPGNLDIQGKILPRRTL